MTQSLQVQVCRDKGPVLLQLMAQRVLQGAPHFTHIHLTPALFPDFLYLTSISSLQIQSLSLTNIDTTSGAEVLWTLPLGLNRLKIQSGNGIEQLYMVIDNIGKEAPWALSHLTDLTVVNVKLRREEEVKIGKLVKRMGNLERLEIVECEVGTRECEVIGEALIRLAGLQHLSLSCNPIYDSGLILLSPFLPRLSSLHLSSCHLSKSGLTSLFSSFPHTIHTLDISSNALVGEAMEGFEIYAGNLRGIEKLDISGNDMGPEGVQYLVVFVRTVTALIWLNLNCNYIGSVGFAYLLTAYYMRHLDAGNRERPCLEHLGVSLNDIETRGLSKLAPQLQQFFCIKDLDLSMNHFGAAGAAVLSPILPYFPNLTHLNLSDNCLHNSGVASLSPAFSHLPYLHTLLLSANSISRKGIKTLVKSVQVLPGLCTLGLAGNPLCDTDISLLLSELWACAELKQIDITACPVSQEARLSLAARFPSVYSN